MKIENAQPHRQEVIKLLNTEKLPTDDISDQLDNFFVAVENGEIIGVGGLEIHGRYGLLRSLAVLPEYRGMGIANKLLEHLDHISKQNSLLELYLLTETAPEYFGRKNFKKITREDVPPDVRRSSEFSHVCPVSAIVMKKVVS